MQQAEEDAVMMPPNELPVTGREAIRNWVAPILEQFVFSGDPVVQEMLVAGDLAYRRYTVWHRSRSMHPDRVCCLPAVQTP
jgi:ketosteroid isomerase-like protein